MSTRPAEILDEGWQSRPVAIINGIGDKRIETGEDFACRPLSSLWDMKPDHRPKLKGEAFIPSSYHDYDAREHAAQRERGSFVALVGDVDKGQHPVETIEGAIQKLVGAGAYLIFSTANSCPSNLRWRVVLPLEQAVGFVEWRDAQEALCDFMRGQGIEMDGVTERPGQIAFLPNVPSTHDDTGERLRDENGPLYYKRRLSKREAPGLVLDRTPIGAAIADVRQRREDEEAAREKLRAEAEERRRNRPQSDGSSVIDEFNRSTSVPDMLRLCGYTQSKKNADDWRSPNQTSGSFATRVMGDTWVSLSGTDSALGIGARHDAGCFGDAYDLFVHYEHGGDHKAAYRALGQERRDANVVYLPQAEPPEWMNETPGYDEMPEWMGEEPEADFDFSPVEAGPSEFLDVVDAFDFNEADIPTRPWVIPGVMLSGYTHMLAAPGGSGKSLFTLQLAIALARGEPWGTFVPRRRAKTLIINVEDDLHEQRRRLAAAHTVMGGDKSDLLGMVHMVRDTDSIVIAGYDETKRVMAAKPIVPVLVDYIRRNGIDVLIVDPFTETFEGDENDNSEVKWAMRIWRDEIAKATGCVVYLVHHTTKYASNGAGDANIVRGAGAIVNSTRISATLMPMTEDEAAAIGVEPSDRNLYVRYDDAKANQSLKSGRARWFRKETVTLCNGDRDNPADEVGALIPWSPPGMLDGISLHSINAVLDRIEGGLLDTSGVPTGTRYTASTRGGSKESGRWVGTVLANTLGMKEAPAKTLIKSWLATGVLVEMPYEDPARRKEITGLFAPRDKRPKEPE